MTEYISEIKTIPHNEKCVFSMLSDLSNLERIKSRIPEDKIKDFTFSEERCSFEVNPIGKVEFEIVEKTPHKLVKFATTHSPVPLFLWIQLKQVAEKDTKMKITVRAELNPLIKPMVSRPIQEAVDKISEMIALLPYDENAG